MSRSVRVADSLHEEGENIGLHRFALFTACCTALLIFVGGLVTSTESGLSVPDWPTTYGWNMFAFPVSKWVGGIFYEHSHRLVASFVGFLTLILAFWTWVDRKTAVGANAGCRCAWHRHGPGHSRRPDRDAASAHSDIDGTCMPGADFFLSDHRDHTFHIAAVEARIARRTPCRGLREFHHAAGTVCDDDRRNLHSTPAGRLDAAHGLGTGDSRLPIVLRKNHSALYVEPHRNPLLSSRWRTDCERNDCLDVPASAKRVSEIPTSSATSHGDVFAAVASADAWRKHGMEQ